MSLFIAMLAFDDASPVDAAKLGILAGSLFAGVICCDHSQNDGGEKVTACCQNDADEKMIHHPSLFVSALSV
jgi:hypothetical protein